MAFRLTVMKANSEGALKSHLPLNASGPDGQEIESGDTVRFAIKKVEKQGEIGE